MNNHLWHRNLALGRAVTLLVFLAFVLSGQGRAQETAVSEPAGPKLTVGEQIPQLQGVDQFDKKQDFASLKGPKGLVILFFRSADW